MSSKKYRISDNKKRILEQRDGNRCWYCGRRFGEHHEARRTIDHKVPRADGGNSRLGNLSFACRKCNEVKGALSVEEFRYQERRSRTRYGRALALIEEAQKLRPDLKDLLVETMAFLEEKAPDVEFAGERRRRERAERRAPVVATSAKSAAKEDLGFLRGLWQSLWGVMKRLGERSEPHGSSSDAPSGQTHSRNRGRGHPQGGEEFAAGA